MITAALTLGCAAGQNTLYMVGNAHIDQAYRWKWNETVRTVLPYTFRGVLDLMDREPRVTYAQSQMALYEAVRKEYPDVFARIRQKIREGKWSVVGGQWTEPLAMSSSGEALVREFLIGKQYAREVLGAEVKVGWAPDAWDGQNIGLPQILGGSGIEYFVVARGRIKDMPVYWWQGPDGSRVIVYSVPLDYSLAVTSPDTFRSVFADWGKNPGVPSVMQIYGRGDHGGGPRQGDIDALRKFATFPGAPRVQFGTPEAYFTSVIRPVADRLPVRHEAIASMGPESHAAQGEAAGISYASPMSLRTRYHSALSRLLTAEEFGTIGALHQRKAFYPRVDFEDAWRLLLEVHDHNMLTAVEGVYTELDRKFEALAASTNVLLQQGLHYIGARVDTTGAGVPLLVYNPSSWKRSATLEAHVRFLDPVASFAIRDDHGRDLPVQVVRSNGREHDVLVVVPDLPPTGYRLLRAFPGSSGSPGVNLSASANRLENESLRVEIDGSGALTSVFDKRTRRELLAGKTALLEMVQEDPSKSDSYVLEAHPKAAQLMLDGAPALVEAGPVRATIRCRFRSEDSLLGMDVTLSANSDLVEFAVDADWHDRDKALVVKFPVRLDAPRATYERAYAVEELPANGSREPLQHWFDLSSSDFGASLLVAGIGEGYAEASGLRMTLLRGTRDMNARMDEGLHHLRYALYPHTGSWRLALTPRHAEEFNAALVAMQEAHHEGRLTGWGERSMLPLPREYSFLGTAPSNVIATAVKISQAPWERDALIVRVYETSGKATQAELKLGFDVWSAEEVNLVEEPTGNKLDFTNNTLRFDLGAGKLKTFRLIVSARGGLRDVPAIDTGGENEGGSAKGQRKTGM